MAHSLIWKLRLDTIDAWSGIRRRPMRSLLSGLGIGIGVVSLVAMLSIGEGAKQKTLQKMDSLGLHTLRIEQRDDSIGSHRSAVNISQGLTANDVHMVRTMLDQAVVAPYLRKGQTMLTASDTSTTATLIGSEASWLKAERLELMWGRNLLPQESMTRRRVCILGKHVAADLRIKNEQYIRVDRTPCLVVGVLRQHGRLLTEGTGLSTLNFDRMVLMPWSSYPFANKPTGTLMPDGLVILMPKSDESQSLRIAQYIEKRLLVAHRGVRDFLMVVPLRLLKETRETQNLFSLVMASIAALSLLVGGIGVMNIMLANISEQTREIGLRMAIGASPNRIITLYLLHAIWISAAGSLWGVMGGMLVAWFVQLYAGWPVAFSLLSLTLGPISAMVTGLVFGIFPASRAASLQPAQALRES
ncbi:MAG: ABC transporter permease [Mariprofundaceae bacterium]